MTTQQNEQMNDMEQQRARWQEEVRQIQQEEEQNYFAIEKKLMPLIALVVPCCFIAYFFYSDVLLLAGRWFWLLWTGSILIMLRYSFKLNHLADKFCIGLLLCGIMVMAFSTLGYGHVLDTHTAQLFVVLYKLACIVGVICSIYPIKLFWMNRKQINEMEVTNPWK